MAAIADQPSTKPRDPAAFMESVRGNTLGAAVVLEDADISVGMLPLSHLLELAL